jgi:hypothetical protein
MENKSLLYIENQLIKVHYRVQKKLPISKWFYLLPMLTEAAAIMR